MIARRKRGVFTLARACGSLHGAPGLRKSSGSLAMLAAIRRASSHVKSTWLVLKPIPRHLLIFSEQI
jgi:fructose/tagatose bisphosphate aldolase